MDDEFNYLALVTLSKILSNIDELENNVADIDGCSSTIANNLYFDRKTEYYLTRHKLRDPKKPYYPLNKEPYPTTTPKVPTTMKVQPPPPPPPQQQQQQQQQSSVVKPNKIPPVPPNSKPPERKKFQQHSNKSNISIDILDDPEFQIEN